MKKYFMGIDEGGYDKRTYVAITMDQQKNIISHYYGHDKSEFDKHVAEVSQHYNISPENIMYEIN